MMRLTTMWRVDRTVDDVGSSPIAERLLEAWGYDPGSLRFHRSSANFTYRFTRAGTDLVLRFAHESDRRREEVEAEMELLGWLDRTGMAVAAPIRSLDGEHVVSCATDAGLLHAVVFPWLEGSEREADELDEGDFRVWGASLGRLHRAFQEYVASHEPRRPSWQDQLLLVEEQAGGDGFLRAELDAIRAVFEALPVDATSFGLIHGDFQLDNVLWKGDALQLIDFDDCGYHWYVADIALALADLLPGGADPKQPPLRGFLEGYRRERPLGEAALAQLDGFRRAGELVQHAKIRRSCDLPPENGHPEWLSGLDGKLRLLAEEFERSLAPS